MASERCIHGSDMKMRDGSSSSKSFRRLKALREQPSMFQDRTLKDILAEYDGEHDASENSDLSVHSSLKAGVHGVLQKSQWFQSYQESIQIHFHEHRQDLSC